MGKIYCAKCKKAMVIERVGVRLRWRYDNSNQSFVIAGDQFACKQCGATAYHIDSATRGAMESAPALGAHYVDVEE